MSALLLLIGLASAGVDGHGPLPPPADGDPGRPLRSWGGQALDGGSAAVVGEYASEPVNLYLQDGDGAVHVRHQVEDVGLAILQLAHGFGRVAVGAVIPVVPYVSGEFGSGAALADPLISLPVALLDGAHGGLSLIPGARFGIGAHDRYLGTGSFSGEVHLAGTLVAGGLRATVDAGYEGRPTVWMERLELGGPQLVGGAALGWVFEPVGIGAHAELVAAYGLGNTTGNAVPVELTGTVRGRAGERGWWAVGGGAGLTEGIGSSALRLLAGGGIRWGRAEEAVEPVIADEDGGSEADAAGLSELDLVVRDVRGAPLDAAVRCLSGERAIDVDLVDGRGQVGLAPGAWRVEVSAPGFGAQIRELDVSGEPLGIEAILQEEAGHETLSLEVAAVEGGAIGGARVLVDGLPVGTVGDRDLRIAGLESGEHQVAVQAHGFLGWAGPVAAGESAEVLLSPVEGTLRVVVTDSEGAPVPDAWVAFSGPSRRPAVPLDGDSERVFVLSTGTWTALVSSESHGVQARELTLEPDAWTTVEARFVLGSVASGPADLRVRVVDVDGSPVEGARVRLGDDRLGATASGGDLRVDGVAAGVRDVLVEVDGAEPLDAQELVLGPGENEAWFTVRWLPGTVRVRVRRPDGPVADAVVLADGPEPRQPIALGPTGAATWRLAPGDWRLLATSSQWGSAIREVSLSDQPGSRVDVEIVLFPVGNIAGSAVLALRAVDPEGYPVLGASVRADGIGLGTTASGGLQVPLTPGSKELDIAAPGFLGWAREVDLAPGDNAVQADLGWGGMVRLAVVDAAGEPALDSTVRLAGPTGTTAPLPVDPYGRRDVVAGPGTWQALAVSSRHGLASATFEIAADDGLVERRLAYEPVDGGQILVEVRDPLGRPVPDATVACDGCSASPGAAGLVLVGGLVEGAELAISAPHHRPATLAYAGGPAVIGVLEPRPVPIRVVVHGPDGTAVPATLRFDGPVAVPEVRTGVDGDEVVPLVPGAWAVTAEAHGFGVQRRDIALAPGGTELRVDFALLAAQVSVEGGQVRIGERVHFDLGSARLRPDSDAILQEVADTLVAHPELALVEVQGHTDATGDLALNQRLSDERAAAVRAALVRRGVAPSRLVARGYGPTRPVAGNDIDAGRRANRRVQFLALETASAPAQVD